MPSSFSKSPREELHHEQTEEIRLFGSIVRLYHGSFNRRALVYLDHHSLLTE